MGLFSSHVENLPAQKTLISSEQQVFSHYILGVIIKRFNRKRLIT